MAQIGITATSGLIETSGPTTLVVGAVADGEFLRRSGTTLVGATAGASPFFTTSSTVTPALASNTNTTAGGDVAVASGSNATAYGYSASASGNIAAAFGALSIASANATAAFGYFARALAIGATTHGFNTVASFVGGIAMGANASSTNTGAIAHGANTFATHLLSIALGDSAISTAANRCTIGTIGGAADLELQIGSGFAAWGATPPASQPTVTGSRGGNAALASLLTAIAATGLIVDGTTA